MQTPNQRLYKNVFSSWSSTFITAVISLFMSPFLVHTLGKEQYGIWALALSIISYTALINAGMNQTLSRYAPKYYAIEDYHSLNQVINSIFFIFSISAVLVLIITVIIAYFFIDFFNIEVQYLEIARNVILLVGLNQALIFFYIAPSACSPFHRFTIVNSIVIFKNIIGALLVFYFLKRGYGLYALAIITLVLTITSLQFITIIRNKIVPQIRYSFKFITKSRLKEMLNYGGISFLIVATYLIIFNTDNIVIGIYQTTTAVTFYSIAGNLIGYIRVIANAIGVPLTPLISHMDSISNFDEINKLYYNISKKLYYIYTALCVSTFMFGEKFIFLWMGKDFDSTGKVLMILIIPACLYLPQIPANSVLLGIGKHKQLLYILAAEAISNIILSIILVQKWGIYGVAWGTAIPQLVIYSFIYPWFFNKTISGNLKLFYVQLLKISFYGVLFTLPVSFFLIMYNESLNWFGFIINVVLVLIFIILGFYLMVLNKDEKMKIMAMIRKILLIKPLN